MRVVLHDEFSLSTFIPTTVGFLFYVSTTIRFVRNVIHLREDKEAARRYIIDPMDRVAEKIKIKDNL